MRDKDCSICSNTPVEQCHVKDKAEMVRLDQTHDFFNIILLCSHCHHGLFDKGRVAIVAEKNCFIILYSIENKKFEIVESRNQIAIIPQYVEWKNTQCHIYLQAVLRKCRDVMMVSQDKSWPCCDSTILN